MGKHFAWDYEAPGFYHVYEYSDIVPDGVFEGDNTLMIRVAVSPEMDSVCKALVENLDRAVEIAIKEREK